MKKEQRELIIYFILSSFMFFAACNPTAKPEPELLPVLTTTKVSSITPNSAICGGNITVGLSITSCGVCWSKMTNPTIADNKTSDGLAISSFTSKITGLIAGTTYFVRAYATNNAGTGYGGIYSFTTSLLITFNPNLTYGYVTDIDGNVYKTITIGTQTWMAENLRTSKYRNGEAIPNVTDGNTWAYLNTGAWCNYNNGSNDSICGKLYNWYAATDSRNIAPTGWHVPTYAEWTTLTTFLGGEGEAYKKLKETGTVNWLSPNTGATNESGFTGLPGGNREGEYYGSDGEDGLFGNGGRWGYWWSSTYDEGGCPWIMYLYYYGSGGNGFSDSGPREGISVRCIKDFQ